MLPHPADWSVETAVSSGVVSTQRAPLSGSFVGRLPSGCVLTWLMVWRAQGWGSVSPLFSQGLKPAGP